MFGLDILRGYELSWLDGNGKPQIACMELCWDASTLLGFDTQDFKKALNALNNQRFIHKQEFIQAVHNLLPVAPMRSTFITADEFVFQDLSLRSTALDYLIDHNVRFICQHSGQPFTGSILADCFAPGVRQNIKERIIELRNCESNPFAYTEELVEPNSIISVHFARKGGFSWQVIRTLDRENDICAYVQRAGVE